MPKPHLTPDGLFYWTAGRGEPVPRPYNLRVLAPALLRDNFKAWEWANRIALYALFLCIGVYCYQQQGTPFPSVSSALWSAAPAVLCIFGPAVWFWRKYPVTVDVFGMLFAVAAAITAPAYPFLAGVLIFFGGITNEKAPVFAAIYAWNPYMLAGLIGPAILWCIRKNGPVPTGFTPDAEREMKAVLASPLKMAWRYHSETLSDAFKWVLPWGGLLFALISPSTPLIVGLIAAYALCSVATDSVRLYVWAMPLMAASVGMEFVVPGLLLGWFLQNKVRTVRLV